MIPMPKLLEKTQSLCPVCYSLLDAEIIEERNKIYILKECKKHGKFKELYWGDANYYKRAKRFARDGYGISNPNVPLSNPCPFNCGLCPLHKSHTALANVVVTNRCDLACWYCFFYAERAGYVYEPSIRQIVEMLRRVRNEKPVGCNAVQLTGGEPALRDDIIPLIKKIKELGFDHIQFNTNGIRLANEKDFAKKLRKAGVNTVYLSFDGTTKKTNPKNIEEIPDVLNNCRKANLGVVLVPTVIKSVNDREVGKIIDFALENVDIVRGVNFQPVSLVGMMPKNERKKFRITIPEVLDRIEKQTKGRIKKRDFYPVPSVMAITDFLEALTGKPQYALSTHFACGAGTYVLNVNGEIIPITRIVKVDLFFKYLKKLAQDIKSARFKRLAKTKALAKLAFNLRKFINYKKAPKEFKISKLIFNAIARHDYSSLGEFHKKSLFIGMMHFMDPYNY
ncbi:MAG: radical SAM protein, partial [Candidatus Diapherotrites archaeon]|nr:radical SAM protein [Candidatus Diapherotrites archaeon]